MGQSIKKTSSGRPRKTTTLDLRFQENLRRLRKTRGLKQAELAEAMGWPSQNYVSQLESGIRGFSSDRIEELAVFFEVDPVEFFQPDNVRQHVRVITNGIPASIIKKLHGAKNYDEMLQILKQLVADQTPSDNHSDVIKLP